MSVSNSTSKVQYTLVTATDALSVPFHFLANTDIKAIKTDSSNVDTTLVEGTDYTLTGAGVEAGGTLTVIGGTIGDTVTIKRSIDITQLIDYVANDSFPASVQEKGLDKLTMVSQAINEQASRSIQFPESEVGSPSNVLGPVATRKGNLLSFDATTGEVKTEISLSDISFDDTPVTIADTKTSLEAVDVSSVSDKSIAYLRGRLSAFDGGGGIYVLDKSTTLGASANNDGTILVAAGGSDWYWRRSDNRVIDVVTFGADPTGATDSYAAVNAAAGLGNPIYFPAGTYLMRSPLKVGDGNSTHLFGAGQSDVTIKNDTTDLFHLGSFVNNVSDLHFHDFTLQSDVGGGHVFVPQRDVSKSKFHDISINQQNTDKSIWRNESVADWVTSTAYALNDLVFSYNDFYRCIGAHTSSASDEPDIGGSGGANWATYWVSTTGRYEGGNTFERMHMSAASGTLTEPPWYNGGQQAVNGCLWSDCRIGKSGDTIPWFKIDNTGSAYHTQNTWRNLTFELCYGGIIHLYGAKLNVLDGCQVYDNANDTDNDCILFAQGTAGSTLNSSDNHVRHYYRHAGGLGAGTYDIRFTGAVGHNHLIQQCDAVSGFAMDLGNFRTLFISKPTGTYVNAPYWAEISNSLIKIIGGNIEVGTGGEIVIADSVNVGNAAATLGAFWSGTNWYVQTGGTTALTVDSNQDTYPSKAATTTQTDGFFRIPGAAGPPTGTPNAVSGKIPLYYDTTNEKLYVYNGGWVSVTLS